MTRNELKTLVKDIYLYFRLKDPSTAIQLDLWLADLAYINSSAIPFITQQLKELDNVPRNLPKIIKGIFAQWKRENTSGQFIKYDLVEDLRYPIQRLHEATELYLTKGEQAFNDYCRFHYMPTTDIERCRNKANHIFENQV